MVSNAESKYVYTPELSRVYEVSMAMDKGGEVMDDVMGGFFTGIAVIGLLLLIFCVGLNQGAASVQNKCDAYGKAKIGDVVYECKRVAT